MKKIVLFFLSSALLVGVYSFKAPPVSQQEYLLKAVFLYRFLDYVNWENNTEGDTFTIGVLGDSEILAPLLEVSKDKMVRNRKIVVKQIYTASESERCKVIFISRNFKLPAETIISRSLTHSVFVVCEQAADFNNGAHLNFLISDNKLKFEVNLRTAALAGLKISSQLLQHALTVRR